MVTRVKWTDALDSVGKDFDSLVWYAGIVAELMPFVEEGLLIGVGILAGIMSTDVDRRNGSKEILPARCDIE
jgi:hypothetical protein